MAITSIPKAVKRFKIADYYGLISGSGETATVSYELMGTGFEKIDESPNAQVDKVHYVNMVSASSDVSKYEPEFAYDSNMIASEKVIMDIYDIGTRQKTGEDAIRDYVRVELFRPYKPSGDTGESTEVFKARRFLCTVTTTISNILLGKKFLSIRSSIIENIDIDSAAKLFDERMSKYFRRKDIPLLMLSILEIIKEDEYINGNFCEVFGNYFANNTYDFPEFMIRLLLYTVNNKISPKDELELVGEIKDDYVDARKSINEFSAENTNIYNLLLKGVEKRYSDGTYTWDANQNKLTINDRSKLLQYSSSEAQKENVDIGDTQSYSQNKVQATISIPPKYKKCHFCKGYVPCGAMKGKCKYNGDKAVEAENSSCEFFDEDRNTVIEYIRSKGVF